MSQVVSTRAGTITTTYAFDTANQLQSASSGGLAWRYNYDLNGSLVEVTPKGSLNGARRYTYNDAGYLAQVESHNGASYQLQAEMTYNGLGQRLAMTAYALGQSVTTQYTLDTAWSGYPLAAEADGQTTYYLYGRGPLAEKTTGWSYYLKDGQGTARQLADPSGLVTLARTFTPWGDALDQHGSGDLAWGYFGGYMDAATGLLYVGNGQYYDPATGRFLTRQPEQINPYVPGGDPLGASVGVLGLLGMLRRRKRKGKLGRLDMLFLLLVVLAGGASLAACEGVEDDTLGPSPIPPTQPPGDTVTPSPLPSQPGGTPIPPSTPDNPSLPTATCTLTSVPGDSTPSSGLTPTPEPKNWLPDKVIFTRYVTVTESDTFFKEGSGAVPIETVAGGTETTLQTVPVWRFYVGNADSPTWSVYWNGSGELTHPDSLSMSGGKKYVQVDTNNKPIYYDYQFSASYYFTEQVTGACGKALSSNANAIAVANNKFGSFGHNCGDQYYIDIPGLGNTIFTVMDRGTFVVEGDQPDHFDIYVGIQDHESFENSPLAQYDGQLVRVAKVQP